MASSSSRIPKYLDTDKDTAFKQSKVDEDNLLLSFDVNSFFQNDCAPASPKLNENDANKNADTISECCRDDLSQFYESSQVMRQLETVIDNCDVNNGSQVEENKENCIFKSPKPKRLKKIIEKLKNDEEGVWDDTNTVASEISRLFQSSQYKQEVADVFNKLESTICEVSEGQDVNLGRDRATNATLMETEMNWTDESIESNLKHFESQVAVARNQQNDDGIVCNDYEKLGPFYDLPLKVKELIQQYKGIDSLYDWQDECLNLSAIKHRKNLVYALPTSGGKTLVSEILIFRETLCRKKNVLFVLPYVAIVEEKVWALSPFALGLDFLVEEYAAGKGGYPPRKRRYKRSVYIATIEKALALVNSLMELDRLKELGLVVIDELHLIGESSRGATLETLLTKIIYAKENIQIVGMSATIGNLPEICKFLKAEVYTKEFRPVELKEFIKCGSEIYQIDRNAISDEDRLIPIRTVNFQVYLYIYVYLQ